MSAIEYNKLIFKVCQRLNEMSAIKQLLFMCRGKVAPRNEENLQDAFSLFEELEKKEFLGPDRLDVLKDLLEGFEEWSLLENVEKFEAKRKEYDGLIEHIIQALDELNDLERILLICREKIAEERQSDIHDVQSLFKELKNNNSLEINRLDILKEVLTKTEKRDLLERVEEFEARKSWENKFQRRKAQAAAIASSACGNLRGVLNIKMIFRAVAGGVVIASAFELLRRGSTYDQLVTAINTCVLPAGAKLIQITEGSVNLEVQTKHISALDTLWSWYKDGTLKGRLQALFIIDKIRELADVQQVEVIVTIDEEEYEKARKELISEAQGPVVEREEWQEKFAYIQSYLEQTKDIDSQSVATETSDSGMPGSHGLPSELGIDETSDSYANLCLKDLSDAVTEELAQRLENDPTALQLFYQSFGLDAKKSHPWRRLQAVEIFQLFPETPVTLLRDAFEILQLYDLVELLEKVKPRTLRPALPLKEMDKLLNASKRPTKFYSKAKVLTIEYSDSAVQGDSDVEKIESFFKALDLQNQVTRVTAKVSKQLGEDLIELTNRKAEEDRRDRIAQDKETMLKELLQNKFPQSWYSRKRLSEVPPSSTNTNEELLSSFYKEEPAMKKSLEEVTEEREKRKLKVIKIEEEITQREEELQVEQHEKEKFQRAVLTVLDKWIWEANDEDRESALFVVLQRINFTGYHDEDDEILKTTHRCLNEKFPLIPSTKVVITENTLWPGWNDNERPQETLEVRLYGKREFTLATLLEVLNKRWKTMDILSLLREAQRTFPIKRTQSERAFGFTRRLECHIFENLSSLPRLQRNDSQTQRFHNPSLPHSNILERVWIGANTTLLRQSNFKNDI